MTEQPTPGSDASFEPPFMTMRQMVTELRADVKRVVAFVDATENQKLPERMAAVEKFQNNWTGRVVGLSIIGAAFVGILLEHITGGPF
jgi:hypothetical protein